MERWGYSPTSASATDNDEHHNNGSEQRQHRARANCSRRALTAATALAASLDAIRPIEEVRLGKSCIEELWGGGVGGMPLVRGMMDCLLVSNADGVVFFFALTTCGEGVGVGGRRERKGGGTQRRPAVVT